ncbi:MAG: hypothetical protein QOI55_1932 [Actinomycetota bacterium]|nr:hypothetical protein [Actinomycetota bacterium]
MSTDRDILGDINKLVEEEQRLLEQRVGHGLDPEAQARLRAVEEHLDQCWDLLRQRRAHEEFGLDPSEASVRPADVVENYEQ